jgi:hypothetical protein
MEQKTINKTMASHPIAETENKLKEIQINSAFEEWIGLSTFNRWHLCLYKFATEKPLCYTNPNVINDTLNILRTNRKLVAPALSAHAEELSQAVFSLLRPGSSWGKEQLLSLDTPDDFSAFESIWHPEYIRYCEQIYNHLIQIPLEILGQIKHKQYTDEALANRVKKLSDFGLSTLTNGYNSTVRNSISHGHVSFGLLDIAYIDKNKKDVLDAYEFSNLFDSLVDTCHSILIAMLLFICEDREEFEKVGLSKLPLGIRFLFVNGFTCHKGTRVLSFIENQIQNNKKQLNIICRIETKSRQIHILRRFLYVGQRMFLAGMVNMIATQFLLIAECHHPL